MICWRWRTLVVIKKMFERPGSGWWQRGDPNINVFQIKSNEKVFLSWSELFYSLIPKYSFLIQSFYHSVQFPKKFCLPTRLGYHQITMEPTWPRLILDHFVSMIMKLHSNFKHNSMKAETRLLNLNDQETVQQTTSQTVKHKFFVFFKIIYRKYGSVGKSASLSPSFLPT